MSQQHEGMWYPRLPEGYPGQQHGSNYHQSHPQQPGHQQGWPGGGYPGYPPPGQQDPQWPPGYPGQQPGYPNQPGYPGYPSYPQQPNYPGYPGQQGHHGNHGNHGHHHGQQGHHGQHGGQPQPTAPTSAPPSQTPSYPEAGLRAVDPGGIAGCLYRYTYVWTSRHQGFWYYPTFVGRTSIAGYRWDPRHYRWEYYGLDLQKIDSFRCT